MFINTKSDCILHILVFKYEKLGYLISLSLSLRQVKKFNCNLMWWQSIITGEFESFDNNDTNGNVATLSNLSTGYVENLFILQLSC